METPRDFHPIEPKKQNGNGGSHEEPPSFPTPPDVMEKFISMLAEGLSPVFEKIYTTNDIIRHLRTEGNKDSKEKLELEISFMSIPELARVLNDMVEKDRSSPGDAQSFLMGKLDSSISQGILSQDEGQHILLEELIPLFDKWERSKPN